MPMSAPITTLGIICKASAEETPSVVSLFQRYRIDAGRLRLVERVDPEEQPVLDQFSVGFNLGFHTVVRHPDAARLVEAMPFRLDRQVTANGDCPRSMMSDRNLT